MFGRDPAAYDRARLDYPSRVFEILHHRCGLRPGAVVFEIGPGTGKATRQLRRLGARPLVLVEADPRLVRYLRGRWPEREGRFEIVSAGFERARLPRARFDLGVAAQSFHWLPERRALRKVARLLRPGGWWAHWGNQHNDPTRPTEFHRALQPLYAEAFGHPDPFPTRSAARAHREARFRAMRSVGAFERLARDDLRWSVTLRTPRVQALWASFSEIVTLSPARRRRFLTELGFLMDERFDGVIELPVVTSLYTARRT